MSHEEVEAFLDRAGRPVSTISPEEARASLQAFFNTPTRGDMDKTKFKVTVNRTETRFVEVEVEAVDVGHAMRLARAEAGNVNFNDRATVGDPEYEAVHVQGECGCTLHSQCDKHLIAQSDRQRKK